MNVVGREMEGNQIEIVCPADLMMMILKRGKHLEEKRSRRHPCVCMDSSRIRLRRPQRARALGGVFMFQLVQ